MRRARIILIFLAVLTGLNVGNAFTEGESIPVGSPSIEEKLAQLFILEAYPGGNETHFSVLSNQVKRLHPGGILVMNGNPVQTARLIDRLNSLIDTPLLVIGNLTSSGLQLPGDDILASVRNIELLQQTGVRMGERMRMIGIDMVLDPRLDIGDSRYDRFAKYLAMGVFTEGILPIYSQNNDQSLPSGPGALVLPYQAPIPAKKSFDYSQVNIAKYRKAGVDKLILVQAPTDAAENEDWILHALTAGADMVITSSNSEGTIAKIKRWIRNGKLTEKDLTKKYERVLQNKYKNQQPYTQSTNHLNNPRDEYLVDKLNTSAIAMVRNERGLLPLGLLDTLEIAILEGEDFPQFTRYSKKYAYQHKLFELPLGPTGFDAIIVPLSADVSKEKIEQLKSLNSITPLIIVAMGWTDLVPLKDFQHVIISRVDDPVVHKTIPQMLYGAIPPEGQWNGSLPDGFFASLTFDPVHRLSYSHALEAGMDPAILEKIDKIAFEAIEKGATPGAQILVSRNGKVVYDKSFGYQSYQQEKKVDEETIYDLASVTKVMATLQSVMFMQEHGLIDIENPLSDYLPELVGSNKEGILIKDILLHQAGLRPWLPFWRETMDKDEASEEYYRPYPEEQYPLQVSNGMFALDAIKDSVWHWIIDSRLMRKKKGEEYGYRYSDMGFYMMHQLAERILNQPLNEFVAQNLYDPLGMFTTTYLPLCKFDIEEIAPTAQDQFFRKQLINGLVHDEGAAMFGGVAGHSGLFSNSNDLAKLLQMLLWEGEYGGSRYFKKETIELFSRKQVKENRRGLGWDKPNVAQWKSPTSEFASSKTFGHTGFTGTAVWVDPEFDLVYVLLSNRINPDAENAKLMTLNIRSRIQDLIYKSIFQLDQYKDITITPEP